jgi:hypothetical protein
MKEKWTLFEICPRIVQEEERFTRGQKDQAFHVGSHKRKHDQSSSSKSPKKNLKKDVPRSKGKEKGLGSLLDKMHVISADKKATIRRIVLTSSNG